MTTFLGEAMDKVLSEDKMDVKIGSFQRTGYLIEMQKRLLEDGIFVDDLIKPQGLKGKYVGSPSKTSCTRNI